MTEVIDKSTDPPEQHVTNPEQDNPEQHGVSRRNVLRAGAVGIAAVGLGAGKVIMQPSLAQRGFLSPNGVFGAASQAIAPSSTSRRSRSRR
jgi:TAT (twin-arginine translocation) pathway signal sequence.